MIDCDVHHNYDKLSALLPWIDSAYRDYLCHVGIGGFKLSSSSWIHPHGTGRYDSVPPQDGLPASDYETVREQLLDPLDVEYAVLTGEDILTISSLPNPQLAAAVATAYNRYLVNEWLSRDSRLKGSLVVATQDVKRAAEEVRAFGDHPDVVQVLLPCAANSDYGDPHYHPIYEAAVEVGLPVAIHVGVEELGMKPPPPATNYSGYYIEWHRLLVQCAISHLISLVFYGVFDKYPELRIVVIEAGVTWLPALLWHVGVDCRVLRTDVPWAKRSPGEIVREHVRLTTQPLNELDSREKLRRTLELIDGLEDMLMFATDYPNWDYNRPDLVSQRLPTSWREKVMSENARGLYALSARPRPTACTEEGSGW